MPYCSLVSDNVRYVQDAYEIPSERRSSNGRLWGRILTFFLALATTFANLDPGEKGVACCRGGGSEAGVTDRDCGGGWEETPGCANSGVSD